MAAIVCSFCQYLDTVDAAVHIVVINGHSVCVTHAHLVQDGDWLVQLSAITNRLGEL